MKILNECITVGMTTPMNTIGMGNPTLPTDTEVGSGDILVVKPKKKMKSLKDYINKKRKKNINEEFSKRYPNVYLLVGIPGSGKSTWCKKNHPDLPVVSRDIIRAEMGFTKNVDDKAVLSKADEDKVTKVERKRIEELIGQVWNKEIDGFIIDDTNTNKWFRTALINELHAQSCYVIGVNFNTPLETCIERRKGQIPEDVMKKIYNKKSNLKEDEVDEIIEVK